MSEHSAAILAFVLAVVCLAVASIAGGMHLSPRVTSPLSGATTVAVSTIFIVLASILLVWGIITLGYRHAG